MLLTEIDHVAIAVRDLEAAIDYYQRAFGATVDHREVVESDGVEEALLKVAESYVQLLTPIRDDSPVAKAIEKRGEGLHHIGYRVADCAEASARAATREDTPPASECHFFFRRLLPRCRCGALECSEIFHGALVVSTVVSTGPTVLDEVGASSTQQKAKSRQISNTITYRRERTYSMQRSIDATPSVRGGTHSKRRPPYGLDAQRRAEKHPVDASARYTQNE